jgi:hypothetical protein
MWAPNTKPTENPQQLLRKSYFLRLWLAVSILWEAGTLIRVHRVWVPIEGWQAPIRSLLFWLHVALPPLVFGAIVLVSRHVRRSREDAARKVGDHRTYSRR